MTRPQLTDFNTDSLRVQRQLELLAEVAALDPTADTEMTLARYHLSRCVVRMQGLELEPAAKVVVVPEEVTPLFTDLIQ